MTGDYLEADFIFKVRKALRYVRLYGLGRTLVKVRGQYHMRAAQEFGGARWVNPRCGDSDNARRCVAIIGCGNYAYSNIAHYLAKADPKFLRCTYDHTKRRAVSVCGAYGGGFAVADWHEIVADPLVRIVFIASNHASHAEYAIACIEAGKHVHIEKPHVVNDDQLERLLDAMRRHPESKVFLGFNRPRSPLFRKLREFLDRQTGPLMINWFIAGHEIPPGHWYFKEQEGGRVLGNLCHWTDLTLHLVGFERAFPCTIVPATPAGAQSDFVVSVIFADRSCASITFSAKGHTFEGVRELLNVHRGDLLGSLSDFESLTVDVVEKKRKVRLLHRDHGHRANILHSFGGLAPDGPPGEAARYIETTARFFLAIRRAIDTGRTIELSADALETPQ